jgi:hypothetical protein
MRVRKFSQTTVATKINIQYLVYLFTKRKQIWKIVQNYLEQLGEHSTGRRTNKPEVFSLGRR